MLNIAIDGPSGSGKSSLARAVAKKMQIIYVDTGALYRTVGLYIKGLSIDPSDTNAVIAALPALSLSMTYENGEQQIPVLMLLKIADFYHVTLNDLTQKEIDDVNLYKPTTERLAEELEEIAQKLKHL